VHHVALRRIDNRFQHLCFFNDFDSNIYVCVCVCVCVCVYVCKYIILYIIISFFTNRFESLAVDPEVVSQDH